MLHGFLRPRSGQVRERCTKAYQKFCNHCTIIFILYNSFMSKRVNVSKKVLQRLYWDERKSSIEIAKLYKCHSMTIRNRIRELGITKRTPSDARMHYEKHDFLKTRSKGRIYWVFDWVI